jgi:CheY-like chemotaxis protein
LQQKAECQVIHASDGLEAVQKAAESQPDIVLLDIGLPSLNGFEAGRRIRKISPSSKILFVTQEASPDVAVAGFTLGAVAYIQKTRVHSDLWPAVEAVLENRPFVRSSLGQSNGAETRGRHEMLFFTDENTLLAGLTRFLAAALHAGNPAILMVSEAHQACLRSRLREEHVGLDAAVACGTFITCDVDDNFSATQFLATIERLSEAAVEAGTAHPRVAICGDCAARLWADGRADTAIRLERMSGVLVESHAVDILCAYPLPQQQKSEPTFVTLCAEHVAVYAR